ncbi:MAG TPA: carbon starvation CstA family protein [Sedimentisphaerales bacterium]|nr:carbon starvation CstA family protein [Sedimentisphaerales bacterium]
MISIVVLISMAVLGTAYIFYGRFINQQIKPDDSIKTPAHEINDGIDYVPAKTSLLMGQHFSAISAAGPIVGPILACIWFGWLPAILWIILGAIFIGGVHDYLTLIGSIRHKAESVGEIAKRYMPGSTRIFFMLFAWLALLYVIIVFTDITSQTFKAVSQDTAYGPLLRHLRFFICYCQL